SLWENYPNVCLEALALGKLVVGSNAGGMAEQIEHGSSGLLFESGSVESLRDALRRALTDHELREKVKTVGPERVAGMCEPARIVRETSAAIDAARGRMARTTAFTEATSARVTS